jgi:TP901 family phage tail tape measure protein
MANKEYSVVIKASLDATGLKSGEREVASMFDRMQARALKEAEAFQRSQIAKLQSFQRSIRAIDREQQQYLAAAKRIDQERLKSFERSIKSIDSLEQKSISDFEQAEAEKLSAFTRTIKEIDRREKQHVNFREQQTREALRDLERMEKERADINRDTSRAVEQLAKHEADTRVREGKRAANSIIRDLEEERKAVKATERARAEALANQKRNIDRVGQVGTGLERTGQGLQRGGAALTAAVTVPIVAAGAAIVDIGVEYEQAMNILQATTSATAEEMTKASKKAEQLGADLSLPATSAGDAGKAMTELAKAGFSVQQSMDAAKGVLQLAAAAQIDEAAAAEITANALNAFHLQASESTRVADLLAASANASSVEIQDVAQAMQQAGAVFAQNKVPIETVVALIGELGNAGIKGSDAGTSLKTMLIALTAPTNKAAKEMQSLGINVFDAQGKMRPFREIVENISGSLSKMNQEQQAAALKTIFGTDAMRAATIIFGQGTKAFDQMAEAVTRQGAAAELAAAKTKGLSGAWEQIKSQLETVGLTIFNVFKGPVTSALQIVGQFISKAGEWVAAFSEAYPALTQAAGAVLAFAAAIGPVLLVLGTLIAAVGAVVSGVAAIAGVAASAAAALGGLLPVLAVVAGAGALAAEWFTILGTGIATLAVLWANNVGGIRELTMSAFSSISSFVKDITGDLIKWWQDNLPLIQQTVRTVLGGIEKFWAANGTTIVSVVSQTWGVIKTVISTAIQVVLGVVRLGMQLINGDATGAAETLKNIVIRVVGAIGVLVAKIPEIIATALRAIEGVVRTLGAMIVAKFFQLGADIAKGLWDGIVSQNTIEKVKRWAIDMAIAAAIKLESHSPSQVFFRLGKDVAKGFELGIASGQAGVQEQLARLTIPDRIETATGKGSEKINAARRKADASNRPGYDLLERLYQDIDQIAPAEQKTKTLTVQAALATEKFRDLTPAVKAAILAAAEWYDKQATGVSVGDALNEQLNQTAKKMVELNHPLKENATEAEKFNLWLEQLRAESPATAAALDKQAEAVDRVRKAWEKVDTTEQARKNSAAWKKIRSDSTVDLMDMGTALDKKLTSEYESILDSLNGKLAKKQHLTEVSLTLEKLQAQGLGDLSDARAREALAIAAQIDREKELEKVRGTIVQFSSDVADVFARGIGRWDGSFKGFFKSIGQGFNDLWKKILADFVFSQLQSRLSNFLQGLFNVGKQPSGSSGGGILSTIGRAFGLGGNGSFATGGFSGGSGAGAFLGGAGASGRTPSWSSLFSQVTPLSAAGMAGGISVPSSVSGGATWSSLFNQVTPSGAAAAAQASGATGLGGSLLGGLGALGPMLPLLGIGAGIGLGGSSGLGRVLGGIGGGIAGLGALAGLSAATLGGIGGGFGASLATGIGSIFGTSSGLGGAFAGLFGGTGSLASFAAIAGPAALIAAPLIIGAIMLSKNKQRRKDEDARNELSLETISALQTLLTSAESGNLTSAEAASQFESLRSQYFSAVNTFKDSKTKRIASDWWYKPEHPPQVFWQKIQAAAKDGEKAKTFSSQFIPTFATGGVFNSDYFIPRAARGLLEIPGMFDRKDDLVMRVSRGERVAVMTPQQYDRIGGRRTFEAAGVPALATGGSSATPSNSSPAPIVLQQSFSIDANGMVTQVLKSSDGRQIIVQAVENDHTSKGMDGSLGTIALGLVRGRT